MNRNKTGSALLAAVLIALIVSVAIGSFIRLAQSEARISNSAKHANSALNLAESGVEFALNALNHDDWSRWTQTGTHAFSMDPVTLDLGANITGVIRSRIEGDSNNPLVFAEAVITLPNRPDVSRQLEVQLSRRPFFANGITTRRGVRFSGANALVNSYWSSLGPPSNTNVNDGGTVASISVDSDAIVLSNATIFGRVSTGGAWPNVGPNGRIYGYDTPQGVKIDPTRVSLDFAADFPAVEPPVYYDEFIPQINQTTVLGTPGATEPTVIRIDNINLSGNRNLTIVGPVIIYLTGNAQISGNASIQVSGDQAHNAHAMWYVGGNLSISGNGMINNTLRPENLLIFGVGSTPQSFDFSGNANFYSAVYAPNASVRLVGNSTMGGALVADEVRLTGNGKFHFDEDLAEFFLGDPSYRLQYWRELIDPSERTTFDP